NRIFNIEWRNQYFPGSGTVNFEGRLYEGQTKFDIIYGQVDQTGSSATVGVQKDTSTFTQYECNTGGLTNGLLVQYTLGAGCPGVTPVCPSPTPTPSQTPTSTATATATVPVTPTPSPCAVLYDQTDNATINSTVSQN